VFVEHPLALPGSFNSISLFTDTGGPYSIKKEKRTNIAAKSAGAEYISYAASVSTLGINALELSCFGWVLMQFSLLLLVGLDAIKLVTSGGS
jgi:hypothetical protein